MITIKRYKNRQMWYKGILVDRKKFGNLLLKNRKMFRVLDHNGMNVTYEMVWKYYAYYGTKHNINPFPFIEKLRKEGKLEEN